MSEMKYVYSPKSNTFDLYEEDQFIASFELWEVEEKLNKKLDLERQLAEAREDVKTYKYDLETLVSIVTDCVYDMGEEERYDTLKEVANHYKQDK
jgi:hypothetical protein